VTNLFRSPSHRKVVAQLTERLLEHNRQISSPEVKWLEEVAQH